jgi:hypothetical protein
MKMKKLFMLILFNMSFIFMNSQVTDIKDRDTLDFYQFLNNFKIVKLPLDYSIRKEYQSDKMISHEYLEKYICDYSNFCFNTFRLGAQRYFYGLRIETNKDFFAIVYTSNNIDQFTQHSQIILTTYSKKDNKRIDKFVLWGEKEFRYLIHSKINTEFEIESTTIFSYESDDKMYKDPKIFKIEVIKSKYHVDDSGKIIKLEETGPTEYPARKTFKKGIGTQYIYPVEPEKD